MKLRTDLADAGVYIFKYWMITLLEGLDSEFDIPLSSIEV
jgi:hypothetical protein